ncbi:HET-domain-containing protein [Sporormia fimetaria CBS 119925]|uniref:HET-domain-containing protein n=1 Tax=Sporormia fimetaria CBS 119925 TaxID=1340428 RepID=A0A6A6V9B1_9PLEO|nr:HET-domain-containing protein [Sporormia fimetaria CBS 119925]
MTLPHTCPHCQIITIKPPLSHRNRNDFRIQVPYTAHQALRAAQDGCPLYRLLIRGYLFATSARETNMLIRAVQGKPDIRLPRAGVHGEQERIVYLAECRSRFPFQVRVDVERGWIVFVCWAWGSHWFNGCAVAGDPAARVFPNRPVNRDVASPDALRLARMWLEECAEHDKESHRLCPVAEDISFTPRRLLEIKATSDSAFNVRLVETSPHEHFRYACLSYCWGGDQPVKTTKETLSQRQHGIPFHLLPRTLQDAITVTHSLHLTHLWIDCLCIIQDSTTDMTTELRTMPKIYTNAHVTISASSASTCYEGFLQPRHASPSASCDDITLAYELSPDVLGTVHLFEDETVLVKDPISKRAWTLQERRLSPRFLDFSSQQLKWMCASRAYHDGGLPSAMYDTDARVHDVQTAHRNGADVESVVFRTWTSIIDDYTQRFLAFPENKLTALAALASQIADKLHGISYLAGLWNVYLAPQLLWRLWDRPERRVEYRAPSWSWASVEGWVMLEREAHRERVALEVVECGTVLKDEAFAHGPVVGGRLVVQGRLIAAGWFVNRESGLAVRGDIEEDDIEEMSDEELFDDEEDDDEEMIDLSNDSNVGSEGGSLGDAHVTLITGVETIADAVEPGWDTEDPDFLLEVVCLQVLGKEGNEGVAGLLLVPVDLHPATYRRVGYFFLDSRKKDLFDGVEPQVLTIL